MSAYTSPATPPAFYTHDPYPSCAVTPRSRSSSRSSSSCAPASDQQDVQTSLSTQSASSLSPMSSYSQGFVINNLPAIGATPAVSEVMSSVVSITSESVASCSAPSTPPSRPAKVKTPTAYTLKVQFKYGRKSDFLSEVDGCANVGDHIVVEGDRGIDLGVVIDKKPRFSANNPGSKVKRIATAADMEQWKSCDAAEEEALKKTRKLVQKHRLPIVVHMAEYQFDKKKLTFHYSTQASHPDFRALLRASYRTFRCRIWLNNCKPKKNAPGIALDVVRS
eukprot:TRINITY_DN12527_c0_g1_i4.p1 TRINITY_DN12527_c0_g1~~TRINITY_DN12527_c0_g1_i4.p1  ORF type:complete len:297 (+),score=69.38 TRINITY_DN12527_c0_g1_i4:58-891(+)